MARVESRDLGQRAGADKGIEVINRLINASSVDENAFLADQPYRLIRVDEVHSVAGSDGSAVTLQVRKCTGTQAPASGTALLSSTIDLKGTANTVVNGTLITTDTSLEMAAGDRIALDFTGVLTALVGLVTLVLLPLPARHYTKHE